MAYDLTPFRSIPLHRDLLDHLLERHEKHTKPRLNRLWRYYRNDLPAPNDRGGTNGPPAQSAGLPARLRAERHAERDDRHRPEIVIENDIAWRIHALVDFMFPAPPRLVSRAATPERRRAIEAILTAVLDANGGVRLLQDAALLGSVYGWVDLVLHADALFTAPRALRNPSPSTATNSSGASDDSTIGTRRSGAARREAAPNPFTPREASSLASLLFIEAVEAPRAVPLLNPDDWRSLDAYIIHTAREVHDIETRSTLERLLRRRMMRDRRTAMSTTILSDSALQRYEDGALVDQRTVRLGRLPVVHIQNLPQPMRWEGLSDVEPLIPLQDELNTRLSDRAHRVTMQSFRMYLGKRIEGFTDRPIGPGQLWATDDLDASIESFGGDAASPSEEAHIEQLREALDKASGVTPAAAGHIKAKVGNLTSENALRISLMGTIAKIKRKRLTYGRGLAELCELILHALDVSGRFPTDPAEREVDLAWPDPLPADESRRLTDARIKADLGVPRATILAELGYGDGPPQPLDA